MSNQTKRLQAFFYILARDHVPFGVLESVLEKHVSNLGTDVDPVFSSWGQADWAKNFAVRLMEGDGIKAPTTTPAQLLRKSLERVAAEVEAWPKEVREAVSIEHLFDMAQKKRES